MITKYSDLKNKFKRLKSNQSYIISKGMENEDIKRKYLESIQLIIKGIKLAEELNDLELLIILKKKLASIYISIERYKEAIEVLEQIKQLKVNLNILDANKNYKVLYEQNKLIYEIGQKIMLNLNEDILGRYGGEEFIAIIKDEINNYKDIIERIRRNIEELNINVNNKLIKVTSSIGVKNFNLNKMTLKENISLADKSLYEAKNSGKNRVVY